MLGNHGGSAVSTSVFRYTYVSSLTDVKPGDTFSNLLLFCGFLSLLFPLASFFGHYFFYLLTCYLLNTCTFSYFSLPAVLCLYTPL